MTVTDPLSDLLTRIRNAARARKEMLSVPYSKLKESVCKVLQSNGYIKDFQAVGEGIEKRIRIELHENKNDLHLKTISKPGQRIYVKSKEIPKVLDGLGIAILSTPKGILSGNDARKANVGGELLCEVY